MQAAGGQKIGCAQVYFLLDIQLLVSESHLLLFINTELKFWLLLTFFRAEELETALMEMVKQDNRRQLSARVYLESHELT